MKHYITPSKHISFFFSNIHVSLNNSYKRFVIQTWWGISRLSLYQQSSVPLNTKFKKRQKDNSKGKNHPWLEILRQFPIWYFIGWHFTLYRMAKRRKPSASHWYATLLNCGVEAWVDSDKSFGVIHTQIQYAKSVLFCTFVWNERWEVIYKSWTMQVWKAMEGMSLGDVWSVLSLWGGKWYHMLDVCMCNSDWFLNAV